MRRTKISFIHLVYVILIFALLNATLRFSENGMTSLFRILAPIVFFSIIFKYIRWYSRAILMLIVLYSYTAITSLVFYNYIDVEHWIFGFYIFIIYVLVKYCCIVDSDFGKDFFGFLNIVTILTIIVGWAQYAFRFTLPYLTLPAYKGINVYMSNENELGEAFACMFIIYLYRFLYKKENKYIFQLISIFFFLVIGDVKLSLIGLLLGGAILIYIYFLWFKTARKNRVKRIMYFGIVLFVILLIILYFWNPEIKFRNYSVTLKELIFDPIQLLITGRTMHSVGSINDRLNAIVFGMKELKKTFFCGIGLGNSVQMLQMSEYHLVTANSMHNIIFQFLTEFGFVAIYVFYKAIKKIVFGVKFAEDNGAAFLKAVFFISFVLISSQSSIGIMSNYYTIMIVCYICLLKDDDPYYELRNVLGDKKYVSDK